MNKVPRLVFCYVGNKTYDFSSKKKGFFAPKRPNLAQNWHFWSIMCPVGESVGGCGARAVSRKTPIYFFLSFNPHVFFSFMFFLYSLKRQIPDLNVILFRDRLLITLYRIRHGLFIDIFTEICTESRESIEKTIILIYFVFDCVEMKKKNYSRTIYTQ